MGKTPSSKALIVTNPNPIVSPTNSGLNPGLQWSIITGKPIFFYLPETSQPIRVLVALHGMGGSDELFGHKLLEFAQQNKLLLLASTYRFDPNWQSPP